MNLKPALYLFAASTFAAGVMNFVWGDFERAHQPIQAFGDHIPGTAIYAYIVAAFLVFGGAGVLFARTARVASIALMVAYAVFAILWTPRFFTAPSILGQHFGVYVGVFAGFCTQIIPAAGALVAYVANSDQRLAEKFFAVARWIFGVSAIAFGLAHLTGIHDNASMVPKYMPLGQEFWVAFTGACFILAGIAILTKLCDVLAARLWALMFLVFSALALAPLILVYPHAHGSWGTNAYNLAAVGSVWVLASALASRRSAGQL